MNIGDIIFISEWRDKDKNPRNAMKPDNHKTMCEIREQIVRKKKILAETKGGNYHLAVEIQKLHDDFNACIRANREFSIV